MKLVKITCSILYRTTKKDVAKETYSYNENTIQLLEIKRKLFIIQ